MMSVSGSSPALKSISDFFQEHLQAKGATDRYVRETQTRILRVCTECKFYCLADMNAAVLVRWLNKQGASGIGARTRNSYREVMMTFCNWAVSDNSLAYNPFCRIPKAKESIDKRHERRALTPNEVERLLQAAEERPLHDITQFIENTHKRITSVNINEESENVAKALGLEHKLLYATLIYTGLRKGELASITAGQVFLDAKIPHIVLEAKHEKNRRGSTLPLHPELVAHLKGWLKQRSKISRKRNYSTYPTHCIES